MRISSGIFNHAFSNCIQNLFRAANGHLDRHDMTWSDVCTKMNTAWWVSNEKTIEINWSSFGLMQDLGGSQNNLWQDAWRSINFTNLTPKNGIHGTHDFSKIVFREVEETYTPRILESIPRSLSISPLESPSCVANDFLPTTEVVETAGKAIHKVPSPRRRQMAFLLREWCTHEHPFQLEDEASASQRIKKIVEDQQNKKSGLQ